MSAPSTPPIEAVLGELLHERLFMRWLEMQPDRYFPYEPFNLTALGVYLKEQGQLSEGSLRNSLGDGVPHAKWIKRLEMFFALGIPYRAADVVLALKEVHP